MGYDPFKHYGPYQEIHQRINQTNSEAGVPAILDWPEIDAMAEAMADATFARVGPLDRHPDAQGFAMKTVQRYRDSLKAGPDGLLGDRANIIDDGSLFALLGFDPRYAIALSQDRTWKDIARQHLSGRQKACDVDITYGCDPLGANQVLAIKVGEFICLYKCCQQCRDWFDEPPEIRENFEKWLVWWDELDRR